LKSEAFIEAYTAKSRFHDFHDMSLGGGIVG
jgi:hypothetical protein